MGHAKMTGDMGLTFFSLEEANTVEALAARIVPGNEADPGAREAGVLTYIDQALSEAYRERQDDYREGIRVLNAYAEQRYGKKTFELSEEDQDAVIGELERDEVPDFPSAEDKGPDAKAFFTMIWAHTVEGLLSDPAYGGNRDASGWKQVGFPGAHYGYDVEEMRYGADLCQKPVMALQDVERLARENSELFYKRPGPRPSNRVGSVSDAEA